MTPMASTQGPSSTATWMLRTRTRNAPASMSKRAPSADEPRPHRCDEVGRAERGDAGPADGSGQEGPEAQGVRDTGQPAHRAEGGAGRQRDEPGDLDTCPGDLQQRGPRPDYRRHRTSDHTGRTDPTARGFITRWRDGWIEPRAFWLCRVPELGCLVDLGLGSVERGELVAEDEQLDVFGIRCIRCAAEDDNCPTVGRGTSRSRSVKRFSAR